MNRQNNRQESPAGLVLAVISAYGVMSEPGQRYRAIIKAYDNESLKTNFKEYLKCEIQRALGDKEIMEVLEEIDMDAAIAEVDLSGMAIHDGTRDVVQVMDLLTDYHLEYQAYPDDSRLADAEEYTVMLDCPGQDEFATVAHIFNPRSEEQIEACYNNDPENGILRGTESEIAGELLCWERVSLKVFNP